MTSSKEMMRLRTPVLRVDNKSAIALTKNPVLHDRSKHIDTMYHFIRDCVGGGQVTIEHFETRRQLLDILTKPLGRLRLSEPWTKNGGDPIKASKLGEKLLDSVVCSCPSA